MQTSNGVKAILTKMEQAEIVYQDRLLKISKCPTEKGTKYKIEMTNGRIRRSWEEYFDNDEQAIESAQQEFGNLCK